MRENPYALAINPDESRELCALLPQNFIGKVGDALDFALSHRGGVRGRVLEASDLKCRVLSDLYRYRVVVELQLGRTLALDVDNPVFVDLPV